MAATAAAVSFFSRACNPGVDDDNLPLVSSPPRWRFRWAGGVGKRFFVRLIAAPPRDYNGTLDAVSRTSIISATRANLSRNDGALNSTAAHVF